MDPDSLSRRKALVAAGTVVAGTGIVTLTRLPSTAEGATLSVDSFDVADLETSWPADGLERVDLTVDADIAYETPVEPEHVDVTLRVGTWSNDTETIATHAEGVSDLTGDVHVSLTGDVLEHSGFDAATFDPDNGTSETDISVALDVALYDGDLAVIEETALTASATIELDGTPDEPALTVTADGTFEVIEVS